MSNREVEQVLSKKILEKNKITDFIEKNSEIYME